jgi:hypothetical protein
MVVSMSQPACLALASLCFAATLLSSVAAAQDPTQGTVLLTLGFLLFPNFKFHS